MKNNHICAVDIGSSKLAGLLAVFNKRYEITHMFAESMRSRGLKNGQVVCPSELSEDLEGLLDNLQRKSAIRIKEFFTNVSANQVSSRHSKAIMPLAERGNKVITNTDVERIKRQARILGDTLEEEIIHEIPFGYVVDGENHCLDPRQLYGHRLELDLYLIYAKLSFIQNINRAASQIGYIVKGIFYPGLTTSKIVFGKTIKNGWHIFCDIGADTTELAVFKDGILQDIQALPLGGDNITVALSDSLDVPFDLAEDIKHNWAVIGDPQDIEEGKEVMVKRGNGYTPISVREISRIATDKAVEICMGIKSRLQESYKNKFDSLVVCGRTVLEEGFLEKMEELTHLPVAIARITDYPFTHNDIYNELTSTYSKTLTYINAFGIVNHALESLQDKILFNKQKTIKSFSGAINKVRELYQQYF